MTKKNMRGEVTFGNETKLIELETCDAIRSAGGMYTEMSAIIYADSVASWMFDRFDNGDILKVVFFHTSKGLQVKTTVHNVRIYRFYPDIYSSTIKAKIEMIGRDWNMVTKKVRDMSPVKVIFT